MQRVTFNRVSIENKEKIKVKRNSFTPYTANHTQKTSIFSQKDTEPVRLQRVERI